MASGSFSSNTGVSCNIRVDFWSSTNITQNTSTVTMNAYLDYTAPIYSSAQKSVTFNCGGGSYTQNFTIPSGGSGRRSLSLGSWSNTVAHNADGTKTCYIGISAKINITYSGRYIGEISAGGDVRLDNIPRTATIETATDFDIELSKRQPSRFTKKSNIFNAS